MLNHIYQKNPIIRPTFSYMGNFTISDNVFRQIMEYIANKTKAIHKVSKLRVDNTPEGPSIYVEVIIVYGANVIDAMKEFKQKSIKEIENLTAMNVQRLDIVAKGIYVEEKTEKES